MSELAKSDRATPRARVIVSVLVLLFLGVTIGFSIYQPGQATLLAEILSAFLGALVAVWGAVWVSDHRQRADRRELKGILQHGVQLLLEASNHAVNDTVGGNVDDRKLKSYLRGIHIRWAHVHAFSPYRELGSFPLVSVMADIDAACQLLIPLLEEEVPRSEPGAMGIVLARMVVRERTTRTVHAGAENVARACQEALRRLSN